MIHVLTDTPPHLVGLRISGRIEAGDVGRVAERLEAALAEHEQVNFFVEIVSLGGIAPQAILKDVQVGLGQIKNVRRLQRVAVVSDNEWIRAGTEWEDRLFSSIRLRTFAPAERDAALRWTCETPAATGPPKRGLEAIPTQDASVLAFAAVGPITGADIEAITPKLSAAYEQHGRVNLLLRLDAGYAFRLDVFSGQLAELKTDALGHVERYSVVGAPAWMQSAAGLAAPLLKMKMHFFGREDEAAAWDWVGSRPAADAPKRLPERSTER